MAANDDTLFPSPAVVVALEKFRETGLPGYFAVSEDGAVSGSAFCRRDESCGAPARELAVRFCSERGKGRPCRVFADAQSRLWQGEVVMPSPEDLDLVRRGWHTFPTKVSWPSDAPPTRGWSLMPEGPAVGWIKISRAGDGGACFGSYAAKDEDQGRWQLACSFERTASGSYQRETGRWVLEGQTPDGDKVRIVTTFK